MKYLTIHLNESEPNYEWIVHAYDIRYSDSGIWNELNFIASVEGTVIDVILN